MNQEEAAQFAPLAGDHLQLLGPEDIEKVAADIPDNSSAGLLLFEHTWAIGLRDAIRDAGGVAIAGVMVAADVLQSLEEELEAAQQTATGENTAAARATQ